MPLLWPRLAILPLQRIQRDLPVDTDPTAIKLRLSKSQMAIIWPGLDLIAKNYFMHVSTGESPNSYPFRTLPLPQGYDSGTWRQEFMDRIVALWKRLEPKKKLGGRVRLNFIELRVAALSARVTLKLKRMEAYGARKWSPESKRRRRLDRPAIVKFGVQTQRVIQSLERNMKKANRRFLSMYSQSEFRTLSKYWRSHLRWIRFHLTFFKSHRSLTGGYRKLYQLQIDTLVQIANEALLADGYELPDSRELRRAIRLFIQSSRRGRRGSYNHRFLLEHPSNPLGRSRLVDFIERRLELKEAS